MKKILSLTTSRISPYLLKSKEVIRKTVWFLSRLMLWGLVWLAIKFTFTLWQRYDTREIISQVAFPYFSEATWWNVAISSSGMFGEYEVYEAKLTLSTESINKIVKEGYEKFDLTLAARGTDAPDSETLRKKWHGQYRLFGAPPQLGSELPWGNYRPSLDFTHDDIYYQISEVGAAKTFAVVINGTRGLAWVYIGPI